MEARAVNGECEGTGKIRYATARAAYSTVEQAYWARRTKKRPRRVYFCKQCQGYHLSSNGDVWGRRDRLQRLDRAAKTDTYIARQEPIGSRPQA